MARAVVYITKNKIWIGEKVFDWNGVSMDEVFGRVKKELGVDKVRIVLGNDVSFVMAVNARDTFLTREKVLELIKPWMTFEIDKDCFDWKQVILGHDEVWVQVVAMEKWFLLSLSSAVKKNGIEVNLVTSIGVLLAETMAGRETPVILKWANKESLLVLAVNGLADLVVSGIKEEDLMIYAKKKWGLAVNPEKITLDEREFNLSERIFSERTKGEDRVILNVPLLKGIVSFEEGEDTIVEEEKKPLSVLKILLILLAVVAVAGAVLYITVYGK